MAYSDGKAGMPVDPLIDALLIESPVKSKQAGMTSSSRSYSPLIPAAPSPFA